MTADELIAVLRLRPHPEGGWYAETFRDAAVDGTRAASSTIYFLLKAGEKSHWHRVDATEHWLFHAGAPLELSVSPDGRAVDTHRLGAAMLTGERPQWTVPPGAWQAARTTGEWTLVSCVVAPAFEFKGFTLAAPGWQPG